MVVPPFTSRLLTGVVVPIPTLAVVPVPDWNSTELPMFEVEVHSGKELAVPEPVTALVEGVAEDDAAVADQEPVPPLGGAANTKAEGGNPPKVAASPAFSAYG